MRNVADISFNEGDIFWLDSKGSLVKQRQVYDYTVNLSINLLGYLLLV